MKVSFEIIKGSRSNKSPAKAKSKTPDPQKPPASRRKKLILLAIYLVLLIGLIIYGANPTRVYLSDKAYVNKKVGFSINPPKDWNTEKGKDGSIVDFVNPKSNGLDKITVSSDTTKLSLKNYAATLEKLLPTGLPYYTQYTEYNTKINDQVTRIIDGQAFIKKDWKKTRLMVQVKNGKVYIVAAGITFGDWDGNKQIISASLLSFKIDN